LLTDYRLTLARVIGDHANISIDKKPGQLPGLVVTLRGGEMVIDGVKVTMTDGSRARWSQENQVLLFLSKDGVDRFRPYAGAAGMFEVTPEKRVRALRRGGRRDLELDGAVLDEAVDKLHRYARIARDPR
jgi:hypothetical protein